MAYDPVYQNDPPEKILGASPWYWIASIYDAGIYANVYGYRVNETGLIGGSQSNEMWQGERPVLYLINL